MCALRPFASVDDILSQADDVWASLDPDDWREAFAHHPRLGERHSEAPQTERASSWSATEQANISSAASSVQEELVAVNREYEARFGHIYIVCAAGKTAGELLAIARHRMNNAPAVELEVAAEEQRKITQLRLQTLFTEPA
jgi:2-oxo-4-hydroxy-4-carboxy-5-ureidoimidazoline decarboxylase